MCPQRKHRDYNNDYPSVTQVLGELRKIGLENWYKINTPQFIAKAMKDGLQAGKDTHLAIEHYIMTGDLIVETEYIDEVTNALKSFALFRKEHPEVKLMSSEIKMTDTTLEVNGTMDCVGKIDDEVIVLDWKTTNAKDKEVPEIYDEYIVQIAAYRHLFVLTQRQICKRAAIVSIAKDKIAYNYRLISDKELDDNLVNVFLPALKICHFKRAKKEYTNG